MTPARQRQWIIAAGIFILGLFAAAGITGWRLLAYPGDIRGIAEVDDRRIQVIFQSHVLGGLPVRFSPHERIQFVTPGVEHRNTYVFQNLSDQTVYFTPMHSVAPADAARNYSMSVCFCFYDQKMPPNSTAEFTVAYTIDPRVSLRTNPVHINYNLRRIEDPTEFRRGVSPHGGEAEIRILDASIRRLDTAPTVTSDPDAKPFPIVQAGGQG